MTKDDEQLMWELAKAFRRWERGDTGKTLLHYITAAGLKVAKLSPQANAEASDGS